MAAEDSARRVLVVDDEENIRLVLQTLLRKHGYEVQVADSAERALALLDSLAPDFVIADVRMPGMSGLELCQQIRARGDDTGDGGLDDQSERLALDRSDPGDGGRDPEGQPHESAAQDVETTFERCRSFPDRTHGLADATDLGPRAGFGDDSGCGSREHSRALVHHVDALGEGRGLGQRAAITLRDRQ